MAYKLILIITTMSLVFRADFALADSMSDCEKDYQTATDVCTTESQSAGMNQGQQAAMAANAAQAQQANSNTDSGSNKGANALQCLNSANLFSALGNMASIKGGACKTNVKATTSSCELAAKDALAKQDQAGADRAQRRAESVKDLNKNGDAALAQAAQLMGSVLGALACMKANSEASTETDCSKMTTEQASTNLKCICELNPKGSLCVAAENFPVGSSTSTGISATTPGLSDSTDPDSLLVAPPKDVAGQRGSNTAGNGGGSAGLGGGGSGGLNAGNGDSGQPGSGINKDVITGQSGGGGGGSGGGAGGGAGVVPPPGGKGGVAGDEKINLLKLLPKGATRGLAGQGLSAKDGITGPMGPSLWEKVSGQYQNQKRSLILDK